MARYLIVNADDFGYSEQRNAGILKCKRHGVVSSVSLLANGTCHKELPDLLSHPSVSVGLHFNITEGRPISPPNRVLSLLDDSFCFKGKFGLHEALSKCAVRLEEVETELEAQIVSFRRVTGGLPTHVDGHQHIHVWPGVRTAFAKVLTREGIEKTRVPREPKVKTCPWLEKGAREFYADVSDAAAASQRDFAALRYPASFLGMSTMGRNMTLERLTENLGDVFGGGPAFCELMVHPGRKGDPNEGGCGMGPDDFDLSWEREHEMNILCSEEFARLLKEQNICLTSYENL